MVARVKDKVTTVAAITTRVAEAAAAATLLAKVTKVKATRDMAASLSLPYLYGPPSIILGLVPSTCTSVRLGDRGDNNIAFYSSRLSSLRLARLWSTLRSHHHWLRP
jgi:hypothetical protein